MAKKMSVDMPAALLRDVVHPEFYQSVMDVLLAARFNAYRTVNFIMVEAYWNIGRMIVEEEQQGKGSAHLFLAHFRHPAATQLIDAWN